MTTDNSSTPELPDDEIRIDLETMQAALYRRGARQEDVGAEAIAYLSRLGHEGDPRVLRGDDDQERAQLEARLAALNAKQTPSAAAQAEPEGE